MINIIVFGSCRLDSLANYNNRIKNEISYSYDTKEILEIIHFIKFNTVTPEQTITTFRTPMINKIPIYSHNFNEIFYKTNIYIIEICSNKTYKYNNLYVHRALSSFSSPEIINLIEDIKLSDDEIENDIKKIISLLNKKIVIVGHIATYENGERYKLCELLEKICSKQNILFINPVKEITKRGYNIHDLCIQEDKLLHYNDIGHNVMKEIYHDFIYNIQNK
jgi:hypothetical protein